MLKEHQVASLLVQLKQTGLHSQLQAGLELTEVVLMFITNVHQTYQFTERIVEAFWEAIGYAKRCQAGKVAFVVHGGTIQAVLHRLSIPHSEFFDWHIKNGQAVKMELIGENIYVKS